MSLDYRPEFYERYAVATSQTRLERILHYRANERQYLGRWRHHLPARMDAKIIDLGCGCGEFLYTLQNLGYINCHGIDLCEEELAQARLMGVHNVTRAEAVEFFENSSDRFDLVSAFNLFEHLKKYEVMRLLNSIYRALHPGGRLILVTPNGISPFSGSTRYWDFSHEMSFTPASWRQLARISGFRCAEFEEYGPIAHSLPGVVRSVLWQGCRLMFDLVSIIEVARPRDPSRVYTADMKVILVK